MEAIKEELVTNAFKGVMDGLEDVSSMKAIKNDVANHNQFFDEAPWQPSEVLEIFPKLTKLKVELIGPETNLNMVHKHFLEWGNVGLVLMGAKIDRHNKPLLILLTTHKRIYCIDPEDEGRSMKFLSMKLKDLRVNYWTSNGLWESDCLFNHYNIDLSRQSNMNCCIAEHINIMKTLRAISKLGRAIYPEEAEEAAGRSKNLKLPSFESMVETWLGLEKSLIEYKTEQLCNLESRPLNMTAINLIKKRCSLVLPLSERLKYYTWKQNQVTSQRTFSRLIIESEKLRNSIVERMRNSTDPYIDPAVYDHLDNGCG